MDNIGEMSRRQLLGTITASAAGIPFITGSARSDRIKRDLEQADSPPIEDVRVEEDVMVPMRDGTKLATDIYLPDLPGQSEESQGRSGDPYPTLVIRTPYNKANYAGSGEFFAGHGFAVAAQDVRGTFNSEGDYYPYRSEGNAEGLDGYDTVEWAAEQSWSNGSVGTFGISYMAATQWAIMGAEEELPSSLEAMAPGFSAASYYMQGAYTGGAALLSHNIDWVNPRAIAKLRREQPETADEVTILDQAQESMPQLYWDLPVTPFEPHQEVDVDIQWLEDWHTNETYGDYWAVQDATQYYDQVDIPVLNYGGWYDIFNQGTIWNFQGVREEGSDGASESELIMGPYTHGDIGQAQGQVMGSGYTFPENVVFSEHELLLEWFTRHLTDDSNKRNNSAVRVYVPGLDEWVGISEFPPTAAESTTYYLNSDGEANTSEISTENLVYDGRLSTDPPSDGEPTDEYTYDPADPVPTVGGYNVHWNGGVADRSTAYGDREDILVYQTERLETDVAVVGPITVTLYASTSAVDTDFVVVLSDVNPSAGAGGIWIAEGARRGRIGDVEADPRDQSSYAEVNQLEPGTVYEWKIAVWPTARVFEAGHRIRIDISSSNFPRYDRNLNTGEGLEGTEMETADQTIYHSDQYPSNVELPVVPISELENRIIDGPVP